MKDDPFEIPAFLDRRGEKKSPPTRKANPEVGARREAHRIVVSCRKLLTKARRRKARDRRRRPAGGVRHDDLLRR